MLSTVYLKYGKNHAYTERRQRVTPSGNTNPSKKRREENKEREAGVTEIPGTGRRLDITTTSKIEDSGSRRTATGTVTETGTVMADAADSAAAMTITPPASGVRRRRGREATADAGAPKPTFQLVDPEHGSREIKIRRCFFILKSQS
jgi:hypothetical protein